MDETARVGVIGAGVLGLSTGYALLERGTSVHVYEQGVPGSGQSGGQSRIFRHAHDDVRMVRAAARSRAVYAQWGERWGVRLVSDDGAVAIGPSTRARLPVLREAGVAARPVGPAELAARVPPLARYEGPALLDEAGGSIHTAAVIAALTEALGDRVIPDEVLTIRPVSDGTVELRSGGRTHRYERVVVCAGRSTPRFARELGLTLPVRQAAHVRLTFGVRGGPPATLATLQDSDGAFGETGVYAAAVPGNTAYAVGLSESCAVREDGGLVDPSALARLADRAQGYVRRALPGLDPTPRDVRHCWVTELPWSSDGMGVWERSGVLLVAGHNLFKQAPGLARALASAACGEPLEAELHPSATLGAPRR